MPGRPQRRRHAPPHRMTVAQTKASSQTASMFLGREDHAGLTPAGDPQRYRSGPVILRRALIS